MNAMETGLRHRLRFASRQIAAQHRQLAPLFERLDAATKSGEIRIAVTLLRSLERSLGSHFALEDGTVFPALHGLRPQYLPDLIRLSRDHEAFAATLASLAAELTDGGLENRIAAAERLAAVAESLARFREELAEHERFEEQLMANIADAILDDSTY